MRITDNSVITTHIKQINTFDEVSISLIENLLFFF